LKLLPSSVDITRQYCKYSSGILIIDGKYIKVRGFKRKVPFLYAIDYETHDILFGHLVRAEDVASFLKFFLTIKTLNYPLKIVVADDRSSLALALREVFPYTPLQLCLNHYLENIRQRLHVRTDQTQKKFFTFLKKEIFGHYQDEAQLDVLLQRIWVEQCQNDFIRQEIIRGIKERSQELFAYQQTPNCPNNTNLIELFNLIHTSMPD